MIAGIVLLMNNVTRISELSPLYKEGTTLISMDWTLGYGEIRYVLLLRALQNATNTGQHFY